MNNLPTGTKPLLRARLVRHVLLALGVTWLLGTSLTVGMAYYFAQKAFDRALLDDAYAMAARVRLHEGELTLDLSTSEMSAVLFDQSESVFFAVLRPDGSVLAGHPGLHATRPKAPARTAFSEVVYQGELLRSVVVLREQPAPFVVVVGQTLGSRNALLRNLLLYSVVPALVLLALLAWWLRRDIGRELQPLAQLQRSVEQRDALDLTPMTLAAPSGDIERLAAAINALLARVDHSMQAQREFSGNVAHELRTPLAGIRALADYGLSQQEPALWREQLQRILDSEARASRLVEQLLALALAEETEVQVPSEAVALDEVVRETVLRYLPRADAARVDLGVQGLEHAVRVQGNQALIEGALGNLIDNALRYGRPTDGQPARVTVALGSAQGEVQLSVIDNGPGLSATERTRLVQRGVRGVRSDPLGQGAGLGLAIVSKFAQVMQARFALGDAPGGPGLCATLTFPSATATASASASASSPASSPAPLA